MKIALDLDNTLNKFSFYFLQTLEYDFGYDCGYTYENPYDDTQYQYYNLFKYLLGNENKEEFEKVKEEIFSDYMFWFNIPLMNSNIPKIVDSLNLAHDMDIVTYPYKNFNGAIKGKINWIRKNLPSIRFDQIVFRNKEVDGVEPYDIIIDDNLNILTNCKKIREEKYIFIVKYNHIYNENIRGCDFTINKWDSYILFELLSQIEDWKKGKYQHIYYVENHKNFEDGWYFENEAEAFNGPFYSKYEAYDEFKDYCKGLN